MRKIVASIALTLFFYPSLAQDKLIVISIDGFRGDLVSGNFLANINRIVKSGVSCYKVVSTFPAFTYPAHAAMLSGASPSHSGISFNLKENSTEWNWRVGEIKCKTIWESCSKAGLKTAAIQWPISISDDIDYNIPEIWNPKFPEDRITETRKYATKGLVEEIELNATGKLDSNNMNEHYLSMDANSGRMAAYIFQKYRPNLMAVHFASVDGTQHSQGRNGDSVKLALANVDNAIGLILESVERSGLKDSTTIIIVGDHGMTDMKYRLRPNLWLAENDFTGKFRAAGGSAFYYGEDTKRVIEVLKRTSFKKYFTIYGREKLSQMGADPNAAFAIVGKPGIVFSESINGSQLELLSGGHHGYDPNMEEMKTVFIAAGPDIRKGHKISSMKLVDVAPILAKILKIPFEAPDGIVPKGLFIED